MRAIAAGVLAALLMTTGASTAAIETNGKLKQVIESQYAKIIAAERNKDWAALEAILAPNYRSIDTDGTIISRTLEIQQDGEAPQVGNEHDRITVLSLEKQGEQLYVQQRFEGRFNQLGSDGQKHRVVVVAYSFDIWRMDGSNWVCEQTITNVQDVTVDGTKVAHDVYQPMIV